MSFISNAEGNMFVQSSWTEVPEWLTCTGVGDIEIPEAELTPQYCPDPLNSGQFKIDGFTHGDQGMGTYSMTKPLATVYNFLIENACNFAGRINWVCRGMRQNRRNFEVSVVMPESYPSRRQIRSPVRDPTGSEERVMTGLDVNFPDLLMLYHLTCVQQTVSNTVPANGVHFLPRRCEDRCGRGRGLGEVGAIALDGSALYSYDSEIKLTQTYGATWTAAAVDPYAYGGNSSRVLLLETSGNGVRIIAFRASQVVGHPAECSYSDDWGATWTSVVVSSINNMGITDYALSGAKIVVCCTGGHVYESNDMGESWQAQEQGVETVQDLNAIEFYNDEVGYCAANGNVFLYTLNGGADWASAVGPAVGANLLSVSVNGKGMVFVGTNDARTYRSETGDEGGAPWTLVTDLGGGTIPWIQFDEVAGYVGALIYNTTAPRGYLYRSEDGGFSWQVIPGMANNNGLNSGHMLDQNYIYAVGELVGGNTFIARTQPVS
jgi:photosystem II stability/assembly factor-like uncharacterized protein